MDQHQVQSDPRPAAALNSKLDKKLAAYMAAAAGVSLLPAQLAQAKVVFTPTNTVVGNKTSIDLNNDGTADFAFGFVEVDKSLLLTISPQVTGNAILSNHLEAAAGFFGVPVGPGEHFATNSSNYGAGVFMADAGSYSVTWFFGPWANATNRYLGLKFLINGQVHYGWARLSVSNYLHSNTAIVLTGYAYETTPNVNIIEGHTSGPEKASGIAPADLLAPANQQLSLGLLARGADGLSIWRREDESATN